MTEVTYYMSGRAKKLQTLPQLIKRETINGIRRGQQRIRRSAAEGLRLRSIGRTLFGKKASGAYKNLKREKVSERGGVYNANIIVNGIASIQERGGRIAAHKITRRGKSWMHPGANMPAFPFVNRAVENNRGAFKAEIDRGMTKVAALVAA